MKNKIKKFPDIHSIKEMLTISATESPDAIAYEYREAGEPKSVSFSAFRDDVRSLGAAIEKLGYGRSHIAIAAGNSYRWIVTYLMTLTSGGVFVPFDKELPADELIFLLGESDSEVLFCDRRRLVALEGRLSELPDLSLVVCIDEKEDADGALSFDRLLESGRELDKTAFDALGRDEWELCDLVFTSGTTGTAKGVMLSEHNLVCGVKYGLAASQVSGKCVSVLPYNHTYEAVCDILVGIHARTTLCINESLRKVADDMKRYHPDYIYLVPAFSEHFYDLINRTIDKEGKRASFERAVKISEALRRIGIDLRRVFFKSILAGFGGRLRRIVCGGAPIRPETGAFFDKIGITLTGGYGITECSPLVSVNDDVDGSNNFSSAGRRIGCLEWRISEPDADGIGEIQVCGDVVMMGYYKHPELTAEVLDSEGWFSTGDYGYINDRDEIVITGRKKNIIVLANGKNIYPEAIEGYILRVPYITEAVVRGIKNDAGEETGLSAEIYMAEDPRPREQALADIRAELSELPGYKQISALTIRETPFEKTTSNKIKRNAAGTGGAMSA